MLKRYPLNRDGVFIEMTANEHGLWLALMALHFATQHFRGMKRDDGSNEIDHSTRVCCDLIDRGILYLIPIVGIRLIDIILAVALLHDIIENTNVTIKEIQELFGPVIAYNVDLMTKKKEDEKTPKKYYRRIKKSVIAILVKSADKENVAGTIIKVAKTARRLQRQANEVNILLPIMKWARTPYPEYKNILISCRNHLQSSLIGIEEQIKTLKKNEKLQKENEILMKENEKLKKKLAENARA